MLSPVEARRAPSLDSEIWGVNDGAMKVSAPELISNRLPFSPIQPLRNCIEPSNDGFEVVPEAWRFVLSSALRNGELINTLRAADMLISIAISIGLLDV